MAETKSETSTSSSNVAIPSVQEMFKAGVQFGHETRRWNPKMEKFLYDIRGDIHIIDVTKTQEALKKAVEFLKEASANGEVLFVASKKQASDIIKENAVHAGAHFVNQRWAGGILTNFKKVRESFNRLRELETLFEKGVEGRTKYEISLMKKEWQKLSRLYSGVKTLERMPKAMVIVDTKYEKNALREAVRMGIPVVGIIDSNSDPDMVHYPIPGNDDAISSISILVQTLSNAVKAGNGGTGVRHHLKDYSKVEVQIIRKESESEGKAAVDFEMPESQTKTIRPSKVQRPTPPKGKKMTQAGSKGILEKVQEEKEQRKAKK